MVTEHTPQLRTSRCLDFKRVADQVVITNLLSRKQYRVSEGVYAILKHLQEPISAQQALDHFAPDHGVDETLGLFEYLTRNELVIEVTADDTCQVKAVDQTLFGFESFDMGKVTDPSVVFWGVPYGLGNGTDKGCGLFPDYIRHFLRQLNAVLTKDLEAIDFRFVNSKTDFSSIVEYVKAGRLKDWGDLYLVSGELGSSVYDKIYQSARKLLKGKHIPFTLGGDHSISYPLIRAVSEQYDAIQVVQFDAHVDTYGNDRLTALFDGKTTHHHGNFMSECLKISNLTVVKQLGIRGVYNLRPRPHPKQEIIWADQVDELIRDRTHEPILDPTIPTYITFDIDFLDPTVAPGTATPVANGATYNDTCQLFERMLVGQHIVGVDLVEVNPNLDQQKRTLQVATNLLLMLLSYIKLPKIPTP